MIDIPAAQAICDAATFAPGYTVTRDGRVFSESANWRGYGRRELTPTLNSHGYPRVRITTNGKRRSVLVHSMVALAFLGPKPSHKHQVRHLDGNRTNNQVSNLAWGTAKENADDRQRHGTTASGERNGSSRLTSEDVALIRRLHEAGKSQRAIAHEIGIDQATVGRITRGEAWRTKI